MTRFEYDEYEFDSFEKFSGNRRSMRDAVPHDKRHGQAIRARRREREDMRAEQERINQEGLDLEV